MSCFGCCSAASIGCVRGGDEGGKESLLLLTLREKETKA